MADRDKAQALTSWLLDRISEDEAAVRGFSSDADFCWGPDRIRAESAAKRAVVATHQGWHVCPYSTDDGRDRGYTDFGDGCGVEWEDVCPTLRHLAAVYADHPDYDESWRP